MSLKHKLDKLLEHAGHAANSTAVWQSRASDHAQHPHPTGPLAQAPLITMTDAALADELGGQCLAPGVLLLERQLPLSEHHGDYRLQELLDREARLPEVEGVAVENMVFMDTETTGLAGGSDTLVFLLGLARVQGEELHCRQYLLTCEEGEAAMLKAVREWLTGVECMVTFNGKSFDAPLLSTRAGIAGVEDVFGGLKHIDLLHPTRRAFGSRWQDCRLGTVERDLIKFQRTDDLPGAEAPETWYEWVQFGLHERLPRVAEHNYWDLVSLVALLPLLGEIQKDPGAWQADVLAFARAHIKQGRYEKAIYLLEKCRASLDDKALLELAWLYRHQGQWEQAKPIWEMLAEQGNAEAREWLAKYYEHVVKDIRQALAYAYALPDHECHQHRRKRLEERLAQAG